MTEIRARQWMYVQDFKHLKIKFSDLKNILAKSNCEEWAYIIHDKDIDNKGKEIRSHIHVVLKYHYPQTLTHLSKLFKDDPQYLQIWKGRINNAYSYLIHATSESVGKHKYKPTKVIASFDFVKRIEAIQTQVTNKSSLSSKRINLFLEQYAQGEISYQQLVDNIGIVQIAKRKSIIDNIKQFIETQEQNRWLKKFKGHQMVTLWLWGAAGVGKTFTANKILKDENYVTLGSSNDYFENYKGEHYIILNDLRPNDFNYADLLRITDPFEHNKSAPSRYHNKKLMLEMVIITSPYSPKQFYDETKIADRHVDTYQQLERRIFSVHIQRNKKGKGKNG